MLMDRGCALVAQVRLEQDLEAELQYPTLEWELFNDWSDQKEGIEFGFYIRFGMWTLVQHRFSAILLLKSWLAGKWWGQLVNPLHQQMVM